ncbi:major facilitator superfamily domain-containing protein [Xylogone sp. PMI_703]|nr:major facilitator superfamily domain-containing protein [Xylogone sp. PMI_703]
MQQILTVQSVVILLPSIGEALINYITYNISTGSLILLCGRLADIYGRQRVFLIGSSVFSVTALTTPFPNSEIGFYILRALQGVSSAAAIPAAVGILATSFPTGKSRNMAFVTFAAASSLGSVIGNIAGGVVGGYLSWKWVFWIIAIIGCLVIVIAYNLMREDTSILRLRSTTRVKVDWLGGILITCSLTLLLVALTEANVVGWGVAWIPTLVCLSFVLGVAFVLWQRHLEAHSSRPPLVKVSMFRNPLFSASFLVNGLAYAAFNSYLIFCTSFYQDYQGLNVLNTTLRFLPAGISGILVSFVVSPALSRISGYPLLFFGLLCGIIPPLIFTLPCISSKTSYWATGFPAMFLCFHIDMVAPVLGLVVAQCLHENDQALGAGLLQTANQVGRVFGLAIAMVAQAIAQGHKGGREDVLHGLRVGQWVNVGFALQAFVVGAAFLRGLRKA